MYYEVATGMYCEIILFCGHEISWFDDIWHVVDTVIRELKIICNISEGNNYFVEILNSWVALPTKYTKVNVQWIKVITQ